MTYARLGIEQRYQIKAHLEAGKNQKEVALKIGVHPSTISRELQRNIGERGYRPKQAQIKTDERQVYRIEPRKVTSELIEVIKEKINDKWSPEQIANRLAFEEIPTVSHETIYKIIHKDKINGGDLYRGLRHQGKARKKRFSKDRRGSIRNRTMIDQRPICIEKRSRIGDFERDLVIGKNHQGALLTIVDRATRLVRIAYVPSKNADVVGKATIISLKGLICKSVTSDNGLEFADHENTSKKLGVPFYFCHPYSSFERGTNENTNGLIRQYFNKQTNFHKISLEEIKKCEEALNNRPRKCLGWKTPNEAMTGKKTILI